MSSNLSIRHLRAFFEIARCGSFTRAAESLHLTQSTLTATIKQLEEDVGLTLFDRTTRRVILTREGERFRPVSERLLSDFDTAVTDLRALAEQQQGQVGIAASPSTISRLLPAVVHQYRSAHPNIALYLRDDSAALIEKRVLENDVDFGIGANHSSHPDLSYRPILKDRYGVVMPQDCPLTAAGQLHWQQLKGYPLLFLSADTGIRAQLGKFRKEGVLSIESGDAILEVSNPAGVAALIRQGLGISILPALAASTESFKELRFVPLQQPEINREICIITRKGRSLSPAADSMLSLAREHFSKMELPAYLQTIPSQD
ncbi:MAG: LysR family transcriptional regulator [Amphritea sp.]